MASYQQVGPKGLTLSELNKKNDARYHGDQAMGEEPSHVVKDAARPAEERELLELWRKGSKVSAKEHTRAKELETKIGRQRADELFNEQAFGTKDEHLGFKKLEGELAHEKGVKDPAAVAAAIGRKKYGAEGMAKKAAAGR